MYRSFRTSTAESDVVDAFRNGCVIQDIFGTVLISAALGVDSGAVRRHILLRCRKAVLRSEVYGEMMCGKELR